MRTNRIYDLFVIISILDVTLIKNMNTIKFDWYIPFDWYILYHNLHFQANISTFFLSQHLISQKRKKYKVNNNIIAIFLKDFSFFSNVFII